MEGQAQYDRGRQRQSSGGMTPEQALFFLKGMLTGREPGQPTTDEWALIQNVILTAGGKAGGCGCGGQHG